MGLLAGLLSEVLAQLRAGVIKKSVSKSFCALKRGAPLKFQILPE